MSFLVITPLPVDQLDTSWFAASGHAILMVVLSALGIYVALLVFARLAGLRSFSKMSSFDFPITIAFGSIVASTLLVKDPPLLQGIAGVATLFVIHYVVSFLRRHIRAFQRIVDNEPLLLMAGARMLHDNLARARVTEEEIKAKLREANVISYAQVRAVVMETTGDISVLHADPDEPDLDLDLLSDVRSVQHLHSNR